MLLKIKTVPRKEKPKKEKEVFLKNKTKNGNFDAKVPALNKKKHLYSGISKVGSEESKIGLAVLSDPVSASPPIVHETCQHNRLVFLHVPLHELTVTQLFPVHLLYLPANFHAHVFFLTLFWAHRIRLAKPFSARLQFCLRNCVSCPVFALLV